MTSRIPPATLPLSEAAQRGGIPFCSRRRRDTDCCVCALGDGADRRARGFAPDATALGGIY